ncbi:MAG: hypothetical protein ACJ76D_07420 [Solirubrobacterales bacterium]
MNGLQLKKRRGRTRVLLFVLVVFVSLVAAASAGAEVHEFDPTLSLTGNCEESAAGLKLDAVPDPAQPPCPAEAEGLHPPSGHFTSPRSVVTDSYGNIYVASYGSELADRTGGRIDIFTAQGFYIAGSEIPDSDGPKNLAVDSEGNLYVFDFRAGTLTSPRISRIVRYEPTTYNPAAGEIAYENPPTSLIEEFGASFFAGLAINLSNDHLFVNRADRVSEYKSAAEGNGLVTEGIGKGILSNAHGVGLAVDAENRRLYASDSHKVRVFGLEAPYNLLMSVEGAATPSQKEFANYLSVAADEGNGHFFVYDGNGASVVYEFDLAGKYLSTISHSIKDVFGAEISVDNGAHSPNGALNPFERYLYVPSHPEGTGHSFAFGPLGPKRPVVVSTSFLGVTDTEAKVEATIKPEFLETEYAIEYTTLEAFETETEKFEKAKIGGSGSIPASGSPVNVSASLEDLSPGMTYVFRVVAENEKGSDEGGGEFATYLTAEATPVCPNDPFRTGLSALPPDCRAYELVTPPITNARAPINQGHLTGAAFASSETSPAGDKVSFQLEGGALAGADATGSLGGDPYLIKRSETGWNTSYVGPSGAESPTVLPGSVSADQEYLFWSTGSGEGTAAVGGNFTDYLRYPDGHFALVGRGSLDTDPRAEGKLISRGGAHVIFRSGGSFAAVKLEEDAPPSGTGAIYDRTIDPITGKEETHVVSLLPGDVPPAEGENAFFEGASFNGRSVAFKLGKDSPGGPLYLRFDNEETYEVAKPGATFAGFSEDGHRIFYLEGGGLLAYELGGTENPIAFSPSGEVTPVNVSADGTVTYFVSQGILGGENPNGTTAQAGKENLYRSEEGMISFVGTLLEKDVSSKLGTWTPNVVTQGEVGEDPSRLTPNGSVLLFESGAALTGYNPKGHVEVYRYDFGADSLNCLSCNPTDVAATGAASLQTVSLLEGDPGALNPFARVANLRADGRRAFFQSIEPLVLNDTDGLQDVYEWEDQGVGSCKREGGCIYLISGGQSNREDYLYAVSESGDDVFFRSSDLLLPSDLEQTPSIYDARVGGGFPEPTPSPCQPETCRGAVNPPPVLPAPASPPLGASGNAESVRCHKGQRKVTRNGKRHCAKKHHKHRRHRKAGGNRKGARR